MSSTNDADLPRADVRQLSELETVVQRGLATYAEVEDALAAIRDARLYRERHPTFEAYLRERWGNHPRGCRGSTSAERGAISGTQDLEASAIEHEAHAPDLAPTHSHGSHALADVWERALRACEHDMTVAEIRVTVHKRQHAAASTPAPKPHPEYGTELLAQLRWLLTQSSGTVADVVHQLETRAADIDDTARDQLRSDVLVLDDELAALHVLLTHVVDWDAALERLLAGEVPPLEDRPDDDTEDE